MYDERIEGLIKAALADGMLTEKEKQVLFKIVLEKQDKDMVNLVHSQGTMNMEDMKGQ